MTDIKHNPELPYAVVNEAGEIRARFVDRGSAEAWRAGVYWGYGKIIDTTPTPPYEPNSVLFRKGSVPIVRQNNGQWWYATSDGGYGPFRDLTDADVREGVKTKGWKVFLRGELVE